MYQTIHHAPQMLMLLHLFRLLRHSLELHLHRRWQFCVHHLLSFICHDFALSLLSLEC